MVIQEMTKEECLQVLAETRLARLACSFENQPYVVPVYVAYYAPPGEEACLYGFTTPGQKVEWMRANPLVCVEVDAVESYDQWMSVIVLGRFEELPAPQGDDGERHPTSAASSPDLDAMSHTTARRDEPHLAHQVLQAKGMWWEPASTAWAARTHRDPSDPFILVYYKVRIEQVTGHRATGDAHEARPDSVPPAPARKPWWLHSALSPLIHGARKRTSR